MQILPYWRSDDLPIPDKREVLSYLTYSSISDISYIAIPEKSNIAILLYCYPYMLYIEILSDGEVTRNK